ncbi:hypothetical protein BDV96DRAFT_594983 [Lophiotrema nucula]|uniref:Zn(2)-C6 fungal-type domain-containing protein n=1 Tax=Lophiotrema nucula TaxID=690887 RepID=A0A6A5ZLR1_9PLEO|nr:hypothetical protein BDV96DRAFT_594983 [Lophiotrema nucula]
MNTNTKDSKHIACARCRERKVRCDGEKPSCRRCLRHGQGCQYIRGKKQQVKNEWVQHLRTFSAQPAKKKAQPTPRSSAPRTLHPVMQDATPEYLASSSPSYSSRSSSPYYENAAGSVMHNAGLEVTDQTDVSGDTHDWVVTTSTSGVPLDPNYMGPSHYETSQATFCEPEYVSTGYNVEYEPNNLSQPQPHYHMSGPLRSNTPCSQSSEEANLEYYFDPTFPYTSASHAMSSTDVNDWARYYYIPSPFPLNKSTTTEF